MKDWIKGLQQMNIGEIRLEEPLAQHTTFRIGGACEAMVLPDKMEQVAQLLDFARQNRVPVYVLGGGSNILAADEGFCGLIIKLGGRLKGLEITGNELIAEAGLPLPVLARRAAEANLGGLAFAAGIPGTVGGAVVMNAGAHGGQMSDIITSITYCDHSGHIQTIPAEEAGFVYRSSIFRQRPDWTVLQITGQLESDNGQKLLAQMEIYKKERIEKQPQGQPSAGSVFKNPPHDTAGRLIQAIGAKGWSVGGAQVSQKHSNFIVNIESATCDDVLALIKRIQQAVWEAYGIHLEREIILLGRDE